MVLKTISRSNSGKGSNPFVSAIGPLEKWSNSAALQAVIHGFEPRTGHHPLASSVAEQSTFNRWVMSSNLMPETTCGIGETGRRNGLKIRRRNPCRFESDIPHQFESSHSSVGQSRLLIRARSQVQVLLRGPSGALVKWDDVSFAS